MKVSIGETPSVYTMQACGDYVVSVSYPKMIGLDSKDNYKLARSQMIQYVLQQIRNSIEKALDE